MSVTNREYVIHCYKIHIESGEIIYFRTESEMIVTDLINLKYGLWVVVTYDKFVIAYKINDEDILK